MGLAATLDKAKEMSNPICESGNVNTVKNLVNATAGVNEQGGIKNAIAAKRAHFDQWIGSVIGRVSNGSPGEERMGLDSRRNGETDRRTS